VIGEANGRYARFIPFNFVTDTVKQTWSFEALVDNLMAGPIGTLDGRTAIGSTVFVTDKVTGDSMLS